MEKTPGLHFHPLVCGREILSVSTYIKSTLLRGSSVPDLRGSPMNVSVIINYFVVDPMHSEFAVDNLSEYINN